MRRLGAALREQPAAFALAAIVLLALLLRLIHYQAITELPYPRLIFVYANSDMFATWEWSSQILAGDVLGRDTYHPQFAWMQALGTAEQWQAWWGGAAIFQQAPLYPYFVAIARALTGAADSAPILLIQLVLGALQPWLAYALARRLFDDRRAALIAAALTALYAPFIFYQGALLRDALVPLLDGLALLLALRALQDQDLRDWILAGLALGLAVLAKPTIALMAPVILGFQARKLGLREPRLPKTALAFLAGGALLALPLIGRNLAVGASPLSISNRAAEGFIEGNAPDALPLGLHHPASMKTVLEKAEGSTLGAMIETLRLYDGQWTAFVAVQWTKLRGILEPFEIPNNLAYLSGEEASPLLRVLPGYGLILPFALAGLVLAWPRRSRHGLALAYLGVVLVGLMFAIILARYRLPLIAALILYAGRGLSLVIEDARKRSWRRPLIALILGLNIAALQQLLIPDPQLRQRFIGTGDVVNLARLLEDEGQPRRAIALWEAFIARVEGSESPEQRLPYFRGELAELMLRTAKKPEDRALIDKAAKLELAEPGDRAGARYAIARALHRIEAVEEARRMLRAGMEQDRSRIRRRNAARMLEAWKDK